MNELRLLKNDELRGIFVVFGWLVFCRGIAVVGESVFGRSGAVRRRTNEFVVNLLRVSERDPFH